MKKNWFYVLAFILGLFLGFAIGEVVAGAQYLNFFRHLIDDSGALKDNQFLDQLVRYGMARLGFS